VPFKSKLTKLELTENSILNSKTADVERTEAKNIASEPFVSVLMSYFIRACLYAYANKTRSEME